MQEEVTQKTIALSIRTGRLTGRVLQIALQKFLQTYRKKQDTPHKGKQTLRQLMKHNAGVSNIEITDQNIKAFSHTAKKYGIDFSLKKDTTAQPPRYLHLAYHGFDEAIFRTSTCYARAPQGADRGGRLPISRQ